jgi:hypothetical protein
MEIGRERRNNTKEGGKPMMEFALSKKPLQNNPSCAYCGKVFNEKGLTLQLRVDSKSVDFPLCQPCFDLLPALQATVNLETGSARIKR